MEGNSTSTEALASGSFAYRRGEHVRRREFIFEFFRFVVVRRLFITYTANGRRISFRIGPGRNFGNIIHAGKLSPTR